MFDLNAPYAQVPEPGDSSRILLVQGDISLWLGWPPSDHFPTPAWARAPAKETLVPLDLEARVHASSTKMAGMKNRLEEAAKPAHEEQPVMRSPEPAPLKVQPVKKPLT